MTELLILFGLIFIVRVVFMAVGSADERAKSQKINNNFKPFIAVVVAARNEEDKIEDCILSIKQSNYDNFQIIAVNDRSSDNTGLILDNLAKTIPNLKVVHLLNDEQKGNLKGKAGALHQGFLNSDAEYFLITDADCTVNKNWISSVVAEFQKQDLVIVPSFTLIKGERFFDKIQAVEWVYMHTMASAGVNWGLPLGCYGNNLSISAKKYFEVGGYEKIKFSVTEDLALLQEFIKSGGKAHYKCSYDSAVHTLPEKSFKDYFNQHRRWAIGGLGLGWKATIFVATSVFIWLGLLISALMSDWNSFLIILAVRFLGDFSIILPSLIKLKQLRLFLWTFPAILFFLVMELVAPFMIINKEVVWKGQVFGHNK